MRIGVIGMKEIIFKFYYEYCGEYYEKAYVQQWTSYG